MINDKILDFKEISEKVEEVSTESILNHLHSVPQDIMDEYIDVLKNYTEDLIVLKNVISSVSSPNLCRHLVDGLNNDQLVKLNNIALNLSSVDPLNKINEIVKSTFSLVIPTQESLSKALKFVMSVKSLNIDYNKKAGELAVISRQYHLLSEMFCILNINRDFGELIINKLSLISETDLEQLIEIVNSMVVKYS